MEQKELARQAGLESGFWYEVLVYVHTKELCSAHKNKKVELL